ncbi:hypothetical protein QFC22_000226 [Naganishia vaughanmartiniae]|uniref:Uncharacterized protein n=1 Tax=Naganishia vaughanmartiniae TaxID=1424756 RepID=A0ACC2XNQ6_9TREE|nr:hypothetical protein QFC22_000226 [Naganishia vaughanmartiniae]
MFHSTRQISFASRQILQTSTVTPAARSYPAFARSLNSTRSLRADDYDKHRVQVNEPSVGTTDKSMHRSYVQPEVGKEPQTKPHKTLSTFSMASLDFSPSHGTWPTLLERTLTLLLQYIGRGATQVAILDLRKEDAAQAAKEMVAKFGKKTIARLLLLHRPAQNMFRSLGLSFSLSLEEAGEYEKGQLEVLAVACNVSSEESVEQAFAQVMQRFGRIDVVDVNILGSYFVAREAAKVMTPGSSIILIGSMSGVVINVPQPQTPYNFSSA